MGDSSETLSEAECHSPKPSVQNGKKLPTGNRTHHKAMTNILSVNPSEKTSRRKNTDIDIVKPRDFNFYSRTTTVQNINAADDEDDSTESGDVELYIKRGLKKKPSKQSSRGGIVSDLNVYRKSVDPKSFDSRRKLERDPPFAAVTTPPPKTDSGDVISTRRRRRKSSIRSSNEKAHNERKSSRSETPKKKRDDHKKKKNVDNDGLLKQTTILPEAKHIATPSPHDLYNDQKSPLGKSSPSNKTSEKKEESSRSKKKESPTEKKSHKKEKSNLFTTFTNIFRKKAKRKSMKKPPAKPVDSKPAPVVIESPLRSEDKEKKHRSLEIRGSRRNSKLSDSKSSRFSATITKTIPGLFGLGETRGSRVFGRDIKSLVTMEDPIPKVLRQIVEYLREKGILTVGLLRIPGSQEEIMSLKALQDKGQLPSFEGKDPHDVAGLLKVFLKELPQPLIPATLNMKVNGLVGQYIKEKDTRTKRDEQIFLEELRDLIYSIPQPNFEILRYLISFLKDVVDNAKQNLMTVDNIIKCIVPTMRCVPAFFFYPLMHFQFFFGEEALKLKEKRFTFNHTNFQLFREDGKPTEEFLKLLQEEESKFKRRQKNN
eukprot:TRINITY_DN7442_c0_g1_i1.p1 TRINITY_DN7442_c0_g1~~TRINITY_DN7442_c0_g1_i1.p1  ORF type:complete len:598 (-),score=109.56 TRINITY_DN7442_c0_g1_i1:21-1814(-)